MPKSDTWPGGTGLESMPGIDSSGSCDSVLSTNSTFSDDSLEHLSAEEKACLMFLEETIDSLDTEDDSGLSNDETDPKPAAGTVASKQAELSVSFSRTTSNGEQKHLLKKDPDKHPKPSYLVPTPFVIANCTQPSIAAVKPSVTSKRNHGLKSTADISAKDVKPVVSHSAEPIPVPLEVNAIPPKTQQQSVKTQENCLQRGPLSYDALVYLRKNASEKKTPLCPMVDHTLESSQLPTSTARDNVQSNAISRFDRFHPEFSQSRTIPPTVPPKPKKESDSRSSTAKTAVSSSHSFSVKRTPNPEAVRQEALQKLGLIKETDESTRPTPTSAVQNGVGSAHGRFIKPFSNNNPTRSPSFCVTRLGAEHKSRGLHSSASFHHTSRSDQASATHNTEGNKMRSGQQNSHRNEPHTFAPSEPSKVPKTPPSVAPKPPSAVGYTVMVVPGMGVDRREALRKLGLLKD